MKDLKEKLQKNSKEINEWIEEKYNSSSVSNYQKIPVIFASSDIRFANFKAAHVDMNLFPGGFNNLNSISQEQASKYAKGYITKYFPKAKRILIIAEDFSRNEGYFRNLLALQNIVSGNLISKEVYITSPSLLEKITPIDNLILYPSIIDEIDNSKIYIITNNQKKWYPDLILLNNDLTDYNQSFARFHNLNKQTIIPDMKYGWYNRKKYTHFIAYQKVIDDFGKYFDIDPWLMSTFFDHQTNLDFKKKIGINELAEKVDNLLNKISSKYKEYGIKDIKPYVFIKAERGTFGIGIMTATSGEEIININKKQRHSMQNIKSGIKNSEVIIQEGVPTNLEHNGFPAEDIIYTSNRSKVIGSIIRWSTSKNIMENLNSSGMNLSSYNKYLSIKEGDNNMIVKETISKLAHLSSIYEDLN